MPDRTSYNPKLELLPPDLSPLREGNTGIAYVTTLDSGQPGPHVVVNALTHGNELCGAYALLFVLEHGLRPSRGKLTLSCANVAAFRRFDPEQPYQSRYVDEDFNRLWSPEVLDGPRDSAELRRARELRPLIERADFLLDIHSMHLPCAPLMLCGLQEKSLRLARRMAYPAHLVCDEGHQAGRRMRDHGAFDDPARPQAALLVECGQHWMADTRATAIRTLLHFLRACEVVTAEAVAPLLDPSPREPQRVIEVTEAVTIATDDCRFAEDYMGLEVVPRRGTVILHDGGRAVRTPYDDCVLIMPGRSLAPGLTAVRLGRFVA
jgi:predicted deacylase